MILHFLSSLVIIPYILISAPLGMCMLFIYNHVKGQNSSVNLLGVLYMVGLKKGTPVMILKHNEFELLKMLFSLKKKTFFTSETMVSPIFFVLLDFRTDPLDKSRVLFTLIGMLYLSLVQSFFLK